MEIIKTTEQLNRYVDARGYEARAFRQGLLAFYAATQLFGENTPSYSAYIPQIKDVATFVEPATDDAGAVCVGVVKNGRAGLIPITDEILTLLCEVPTAPGAPF